MTLYAALDGHRVLTAQATIPRRGAAVIDLMLVEAPSDGISGKVEFTCADLSLVVSVVRGNAFQGSYRARLVAGAGGWRRVIDRKAYRSAAGLKRGPILKDAAREAGEEIRVDDDGVVGDFYVRARAPAYQVLNRFYPNWWIDEAGVTRIASRPSANVAAAFELLGYNAGLGRYEIATEHPAAFVPGARFVAPTIAQAQANLVVHQLTDGKLRTVIYAN